MVASIVFLIPQAKALIFSQEEIRPIRKLLNHCPMQDH
ncbi:hypothetical protein C4K08_5380 [Pseudomonas chlororaphis subsp. aureofaciens]|nr:hypothetical protein C4K08_5380 [Pseudomonas chlororaphis subsp. aureofaciens]